mgnify:CR=1 FL=1
MRCILPSILKGFLFLSLPITGSVAPLCAAEAQQPLSDFNAVQAIFDQNCLDCHSAQEPAGNLVLEDFPSLMKGGESGASVIPGNSAESLLVKFIESGVEHEGKKKFMPPGKRKRLEPSEIALIKSWVAAGAHPPADSAPLTKAISAPKIEPKAAPRKAISAIAYSPKQDSLAVARYSEVDILDAKTKAVTRTLQGHHGMINSLAFSQDGQFLFVASGENGLFGEVKQWQVTDFTLKNTFEGHRDILYSVAVSPDGKILATGSYDQKIKLWDIASGKEMKTLSGHNGAVFGLAFRPDGKILASASGDSTVKLWNVTTGARVDTLSQPLKEVYCVAFSPDGKKLFSGGVDNRIRVWAISDTAVETTNPILESRFAHEGAVLRLAASPDGRMLLSCADDRTVKLWDAETLRERWLKDNQSDWVSGLGFLDEKNHSGIFLGRLDGTLDFYHLSGAKIASANSGTNSSQSANRNSSK